MKQTQVGGGYRVREDWERGRTDSTGDGYARITLMEMSQPTLFHCVCRGGCSSLRLPMESFAYSNLDTGLFLQPFGFILKSCIVYSMAY